MATQREGSKQEGERLPSSPLSLNAGTGWSAADSSAQANEADAGAEHAREREPQPHYLTTSGLFERSSRPAAWMEEVLESTPAPAPEPSELVNDFRSALRQPQSREDTPARKIRKEILALAVVGILLATTAGAIYLYHPKKSTAQFQTAKTWMAKQWASGLQEIHSVFLPQAQAAGRKKREPFRREGLSVLLRARQSADPGMAGAPSLWETQPSKDATPLVLYVTDPHGRRWLVTPTGHELGPVNRHNQPPASKPGARPKGLKNCRSLFYPGCP